MADSTTTKTRTESDSMGPVEIPASAYWGAQTQRAVENFSVSPLRIPDTMLRAVALVKKHAAITNGRLGTVDPKLTEAIVTAADEILSGKMDDQFPVDVFQTGSGTSWNMNFNEVLANRANEILGSPVGKRSPVHPNDHVNRGQSSNDVVPTAVHISDRLGAEELVGALGRLAEALEQKGNEFSDVVKLGRTHLQDAVPMTLGDEFDAYAVQMRKAIRRIRSVFPHLEELALGGTAVGTGLNAHPDFGRLTIEGIAGETGLPFVPAESRFELIAARDAQVELMGALNTLAGSLIKIANDLRLLAGGPRGGLGEIILPTLQPGSSIMPGKVNPVIPEMIIQVAAHVHGKALAVTIGGQNGPLELNMMNPLIVYETASAMDLLARSVIAFADRCVSGIEADTDRMRYWLDWSLALVTPLATEIGYDQAAKLAYQAYREKRRIREVVLESGVLPEARLDELLDPTTMLGPRE